MPSFSDFGNNQGSKSDLIINDTLKVKALEVKWPPRNGIVLSQTETYGCGIGSEYVYCYTYKTYLELAELKGEDRYRIKVGSAKGDPIERIHSQFAGNKTSISEPPVVLVIFRTLAAGHLERWLHSRLYRTQEAIGSEWFNPSSTVRNRKSGHIQQLPRGHCSLALRHKVRAESVEQTHTGAQDDSDGLDRSAGLSNGRGPDNECLLSER